MKIGLSDSVQSKLWGVLKGLWVAKSMGIEQLIVEVDALLVVHFLTGPFEESHPFGSLINDYRTMIHEGWVDLSLRIYINQPLKIITQSQC